MDTIEKLEILAESAKFDISCSSSGSNRQNSTKTLGNGYAAGICHSFTPDGRCVSLLKILLTNSCIYDCSYCINRKSNDIPRTAFKARELADLTISFYRRNYIEGLFLSSAIKRSPDYTMEQMYEVLRILREEYQFNGYIHAKIIPGSSPDLIKLVSNLADRVSVNLELPTEKSLNLLAPDKSKTAILSSMAQVTNGIKQNQLQLRDGQKKWETLLPQKTNKQLLRQQNKDFFAPAGQSTQMIIGASPESDLQIIRLAEGLYNKYQLKRVYYSAYLPIGTSNLLPQNQPVPLLREHRLYQADWLLRFYGFSANELLNEQNPNLDELLDPKCNWAINNFEQFPIEINHANYYTLLRVPGIGVISARKIVKARRTTNLTFIDLKKMRVVLKRAAYFITCSGKYMDGIHFNKGFAYTNLTLETKLQPQGLPLPTMTTQQNIIF